MKETGISLSIGQKGVPFSLLNSLCPPDSTSTDCLPGWSIHPPRVVAELLLCAGYGRDPPWSVSARDYTGGVLNIPSYLAYEGHEPFVSYLFLLSSKPISHVNGE